MPIGVLDGEDIDIAGIDVIEDDIIYGIGIDELINEQ